jgi:hypothetical protein
VFVFRVIVGGISVDGLIIPTLKIGVFQKPLRPHDVNDPDDITFNPVKNPQRADDKMAVA